MAASLGSIYAINAKADNPALTRQFFDFLTSDEQSQTYAAAMKSVGPIRGQDAEVPAAIAPLVSAIDSNRTAAFMDVYWPSARVQQTHLKVVQEMLTGQTDVSGALQQMDAAYQQG